MHIVALMMMIGDVKGGVDRTYSSSSSLSSLGRATSSSSCFLFLVDILTEMASRDINQMRRCKDAQVLIVVIEDMEVSCGCG